MDHPKVTAIIVTWNGKGLIDGCLKGLLAGQPAPAVMVVDNDSADGTAEYVRQKYPQVRVLETGQNLGYGRGCNFGLRQALKDGTDFFLLINQDARLEPDAAGLLVRAAADHPEMGILMPMNLTSDGREIDPEFAACLADPRLKEYRSDRAAGRLKEVYRAGLLPGAVKLVRRQTLEQIGVFDPIFFMYGVEYDYHLRAEHHGWQSGLVPRAMIYHSYEKHRSADQPAPSFLKKVDKLTWISYLGLKRLDRHFLVNCLVVYGRFAIESAKSLVRLEPAGAAVCLKACGRATAAIPEILRHRRVSFQGKGAFI